LFYSFSYEIGKALVKANFDAFLISILVPFTSSCFKQFSNSLFLSNWLVFNSIQESEYDHLKAEITKAIDNKIALEKSLPELIEKKNQDNIDSVKSFKSQIEQEYIDTVKLTTNFKKQTFKRLEKQSKFNTPFTILEQNFEICDFTKLKADIEFQFNNVIIKYI
jgi:exonuclease VII large subunit